MFDMKYQTWFWWIWIYQAHGLEFVQKAKPFFQSRMNESTISPAERDISLDDTLVFIMGTTGYQQGAPWFNWYTRTVPSFRTWASAYTHLFVVLPNDENSLLFLQQHCVNHTNTIEYRCAEWGGYAGPSILLTQNWNCSDEYHGDGPCCKANFALWYVLEMQRDLLLRSKWVAFLDDDVYIHAQNMGLLLNSLNHSDSLSVVPGEKCTRPPYHSLKKEMKDQAKDTFPVNCNKYFGDSYWAHPIWLSKGAVLRAEVGIREGGVRDQCKVLGTSHETGLGQFLWMYQVACVGLREVYSARGDVFEKAVVVHRARPKRPFDWTDGTPLPDIPTGMIKMHQVHEYVTAHRSHNLVNTKLGPIKRPIGYLKTKHSKKFNISEKWVPMTNLDC